MKRATLWMFILFALPIIISCKAQRKLSRVSQGKQEIMAAEAAFARMSESDGITAAFSHFAAEDAVMDRNNELIKGKEAIMVYMKGKRWDGISLEWAPEYVDVSQCGTLGYTYGKYTITLTDSLGKQERRQGTFQTIWKRQADGNWKFVWD